MTTAMARRLGKIEEAMRFIVTTPADILNHPLRIAMLRAHFASFATRGEKRGERWLAEIVLGFSDALLVDFLFFNYENDALRSEGANEEAVWKHGLPWWHAAYDREPEAVAPAFEQWIKEGVLVETAAGFAIKETEGTG